MARCFEKAQLRDCFSVICPPHGSAAAQHSLRRLECYNDSLRILLSPFVSCTENAMRNLQQRSNSATNFSLERLDQAPMKDSSFRRFLTGSFSSATRANAK
jgi:hypothetical protein